ncbi:MAG: VOC family protein [Bacteroidota bacterium]
MESYPRIIPTMKYADAKKSIKWLCAAFGFEENLVHESEDGKIAHAQLIYKGSMIMLGSTNNGSEYSDLIKQPGDIGGFETQSPYIVVDQNEIDDHYEGAKANGAEIIMELKSQDYGGKVYSCKDPEGHLWNFGSYNPWEKNQ